MPWFPIRGRAKSFQEVSLAQLGRYRPEALAGSVAALRLLAEATLRTRTAWPSLAYGILALTSTGPPALLPEDRELLWEAFQVPAWEQCRRWDGTLYAEECAARAGLHLRVPHLPSRPQGTILLEEPCRCGDPSPRIVSASTAVLARAAAI